MERGTQVGKKGWGRGEGGKGNNSQPNETESQYYRITQ